MKLTLFSAHLVGAATVALLAGCGGSQTGAPSVPSQSTSAVTAKAKHAPVGPLLYISDPGTGQVQVFNYPAGSLFQTLTGFVTPAGECVDAASNVYVTDTGANTIVKFAHGNPVPVATLSDSGELPVACAWKNNRVAVANIATTSGPPGSISVYIGPATTPNFIASNTTAFLTINYLAYRSGTLYLDGLDTSSVFAFGSMNNSRNDHADPHNRAGWGAGRSGGRCASAMGRRIPCRRRCCRIHDLPHQDERLLDTEHTELANRFDRNLQHYSAVLSREYRATTTRSHQPRVVCGYRRRS